ncbi:MAG TPA: aldehyde dehydrogenase family protein [Steroidobacteraceae bacterium]|nr:aldehyde dehydrogenase family protein [Steroidobacteraceae bacterium]
MQQGALLVYGGGRTLETTGGYFVELSVFVNVAEHIDIAREEIFGPVLSVLSFHDFDEAVRIANSTSYGLAAYLWTTQATMGFKLAHAMQTAFTIVNADAVQSSGAGYGFSGEPARLSGVGVEGGMAGLESYTRRQTIWFNHG